MIRIKILLFFFLSVSGLQAQEISLDFPFHAGKDAALCLKKALICDTIWKGKLDDKGRAMISLPPAYRNYRGMGNVSTGNATLDFIVAAGENPVIRCAEEYPYAQNTVFSASPENQALQSWFVPHARRMQKIALLSALAETYEEDNAFRPVLEKEKRQLDATETAFGKELVASPLYAARFIRLHDFLNRDVAGLAYADSLQMSAVRKYVRDSLDVNSLYTSGLWFGTLNGLLAMYDKGTPLHEEYIGDMSQLLNRSDDNVYAVLAENLFSICESVGWDKQEEVLANFLVSDGRIKQPTGRLKLLIGLFKLGKGSKAPLLSQGALPQSNVLLIFHETGCGNCTTELQQLKDKYAQLKADGYEVVSVSADMDAGVFNQTASSFPWEQKYCDFQGISGTDFTNFGVIGTPTIYLIDQDGIVQGRYVRVEDLLKQEL